MKTATRVATDKTRQALNQPGQRIEPGMSLSALLKTQPVRERIENALGKRSNIFVSSILSAIAQNPQLAACDPTTVISAALIAASLDLPINPSLGMAHIVPYSGRAQFQVGWKGFVQLAMRSGQYLTLNLAVVHDGQLKNYNPFTGLLELDASGKKSETAIGYLLYFRLLNGYEKYFYMTKQEVDAHGKKYSKSYGSDLGQWKNNFQAMALKTVAKLGLSKYGILSIDMQKAVETDQAVITEEGKVEYVDAIDDGIPVEIAATYAASAANSAEYAAEASNKPPTEPTPEPPPSAKAPTTPNSSQQKDSRRPAW